MADSVRSIKFASTANSASVAVESRAALKEIMADAGISQMTVTSTARSANAQARIMYKNIVVHGVEHQKALYGKSGDLVIDAYVAAKEAGKSEGGIISAMEEKLAEIGCGKVSRHCADSSKLDVLDIAPSSIPEDKRDAFERAVKNSDKITKYIFPPTDPAYHLEIPK